MRDIAQIQGTEYDTILQQAVAVLPWGHILTLMRKFGEDDKAILYYAQETISKGWNRELLFSAISLKMHIRKNEPSDNNFKQTLPVTQAMFANEVFRSGYNLGFLGVKDPILETELEARLVEKALLDRLERREDENRSIGIILCAEKERVEVELALEDMGKPIGVADYQLIVPQEELKKIVAEEVEAFGKELPLRADTEDL